MSGRFHATVDLGNVLEPGKSWAKARRVAASLSPIDTHG
jgi:hypothetical protein